MFLKKEVIDTGKDPIFQKTAENLGGWIADQGHSLVYGGGKAGLMGVVADAVLDKNGKAMQASPRVNIFCFLSAIFATVYILVNLG
jgi:hypothetical protein